MSIVRSNGMKVVLPRSGPDQFWGRVQEHYAGGDPTRWKYLAMLALRENAGWPLDVIGTAFGHSKGHVAKCLTLIKRELRAHFDLPAANEEEPEFRRESQNAEEAGGNAD
jgi:hypothetical protein